MTVTELRWVKYFLRSEVAEQTLFGLRGAEKPGRA